MICESKNITRASREALRLAAATLMLAIAPVATGQDATRYPDRPVRIVVPFPPGGAADAFARLAGQKLPERWASRQQVVVDNRSGAGGIVGTEVAAKSSADGHTLLIVTTGHAANQYMYAKLPYDTPRDFAPVGLVATVPSLLVVHPGFAAKTLKQLLDMAKAKPGDVQYASSGVGSTSHIGAALIESLAKVDMTHVPYKGAAAALQDVMGGRVSMSVDIITSSLPQVKAGKLRALGITSAKRSANLPDVPTVAEGGIPGFESVSWYLLLVPAKTPKAIVERLNADLRAIAGLPDFRARIEDLGGETSAYDLRQTTEYLATESSRLGKLIRERGIRAD